MTPASLRILLPFVLLLFLVLPGRTRAVPPSPAANAVSLFDGTLDQWEGNPKLWRVQDGMITGGSLTETIAENEFGNTNYHGWSEYQKVAAVNVKAQAVK